MSDLQNDDPKPVGDDAKLDALLALSNAPRGSERLQSVILADFEVVRGASSRSHKARVANAGALDAIFDALGLSGGFGRRLMPAALLFGLSALGFFAGFAVPATPSNFAENRALGNAATLAETDEEALLYFNAAISAAFGQTDENAI